jgi:hypothetical protein
VRRLEVTLPGTASSVPPARHFVERTLDSWELAGLGWTAALVVTELSANAALHAGTEFRVVLAVVGDRLRIEVHDGSVHLPRQRRHSAQATTGRGLRLVAELSADWGVVPDGAGKLVWVELPIAQAAGDDDADADIDTLLALFADDGHGVARGSGGATTALAA